MRAAGYWGNLSAIFLHQLSIGESALAIEKPCLFVFCGKEVALFKRKAQVMYTVENFDVSSMQQLPIRLHDAETP